MSDDLLYRIDFQARLDTADTTTQIDNLLLALEKLKNEGRIQQGTFDSLSKAAISYGDVMDGLGARVTRAVSAATMNAFKNHSTDAMKEAKAAATAYVDSLLGVETASKGAVAGSEALASGEQAASAAIRTTTGLLVTATEAYSAYGAAMKVAAEQSAVGLTPNLRPNIVAPTNTLAATQGGIQQRALLNFRDSANLPLNLKPIDGKTQASYDNFVTKVGLLRQRLDATKAAQDQEAASAEKLAGLVRAAGAEAEASGQKFRAAEKEKADALAKEVKATEAAAKAQSEWILRQQTALKGMNYNAAQSIGQTAYNAQQSAAFTPLPAATGRNTKETAAANAQINAANKQVAELTLKQADAAAVATMQVRALTRAYGAENEAALMAGKAFTPAEEAARLQTLKQKIQDVTTAYVRQTDAMKAQAASAKESAVATNAAASGVRGMGNFYPLIVTAGLFREAGKAATGFALDAVKASADYEAAFAQVARTTNASGGNVTQQIADIRKSLIDLDTQMPVSFDDLAKIAHAGNELGIGAESIKSFTKTVAQYSTVTGMSIDNTATAFGSIGQIMGITASGYNNLGSAISLVGRKSVATEPEIVAMTQKLDATAHQAGFTAQQIIGLAGTFASIREAPERAQGAMQIYFKTVDAAAGAGGPKLKAFADFIGETSAQTADLIRNNPEQFFEKFLTSLSKLDAVDKTNVLSGLHLGATRVTETLSRLSQSVPLLQKQIQDANTGFAQGTDLQTQYAKVSGTLSSKFKELQNSVMNMMAAFGDSAATSGLNRLITGITGFINGVTAVATAVPPLTNMVLSLVAAAGVWLSLRAAVLATSIAMIAFEAIEARSMSLSMMTGLKNLVGIFLGIKTAAFGASGAVATQGAAMKGAAVEAEVLGGAMEGEAIATRAATGATNGFKAALISTGIGAALVILGSLASSFMDVSEAANSFDSEGLATALNADQTAYEKTGTKIRGIKTEFTSSSTAASDWANQIHKATGAQATLGDNLTTTTSDIEKQTIAYGKNARAASAAMLANDPNFQKLFQTGLVKSLAKTGFDMHTYTKTLLNDGAAAAQEYVRKVSKALLTVKPSGGKKFLSGDDLANATSALKTIDGITSNYGDTLKRAAGDSAALAAASDGVGMSVDMVKGATDGANAAQEQSNALKTDAISIGQALWAQDQADIQGIFFGVNAMMAQSTALQQVGQDYVNNGAAAAFSGQAMQTYIQSVIESSLSNPEAAATLEQLKNSILKAGYAASATAPSLSYLNAAIQKLGGSDTTAVLPTDMFAQMNAGMQQAQAAMDQASNSMSKGLDKVGSSAAKAAKEVRTFADYANDLSGVFKRAYDIQFGPSTAKDAITTQFQSMQESAKSAKKDIEAAHKTIRDLEADIGKRKADNNQQQYFLSVANRFGDAASAQQAQANIDANNAGIADDHAGLKQAQDDLAAANDKLSKSFSGSSAGAIANRDALHQLYQKYQDYITALAASGADQKTLSRAVKDAKEHFDKQAESLGYDKKAIHEVNKGFDGMIEVIKKVPRNVTVKATANTDPAMIALGEFHDKAVASAAKTAGDVNSKLKGMGSGIKIKVPEYQDPNAAKNMRKIAIESEIDKIASIREKNALQARDDYKILEDLRNKLATGKYYNGGFTGQGGKYEAAGIVHKGEYVIPQNLVNQTTGLPFADALGRLVSGTMPQASYAGGGFVNPDMMVVEPGPKFIRVIRDIAHQEAVAVISPNEIAAAANRANAANMRRGR